MNKTRLAASVSVETKLKNKNKFQVVCGQLQLISQYHDNLSDSGTRRIKDQLASDMKNAMKSKEKLKLSTIRAIQVAIKQKEMDDRVEVSDQIAVGLFSKLIKQRKESIKSYIDGGRADLAEIEQQECDVIASYLPQQLSEEAVDALVTSAIAKFEATTVKDMGKVMADLKTQLAGKADMSIVGSKLKYILSGGGKK